MPCFVYPFIPWWTFELFLLLAIMNTVAMNICVQVFEWANIFISFRYIFRSGIVGSYGICVLVFEELSRKVF